MPDTPATTMLDAIDGQPNRNLRRGVVGIAAVALVAAALPLFVQSPRWMTAFILCCYYIILATGWNLTMGYTGLFSFAHTAFAAIGAYGSALLCLRAGWPPGAGIVGGALLATAAGVVVGAICLRLRGFYLVLVTWAAAVILENLLHTQYEITGGSGGLVTPPLFPGTSQLPYFYVGLALAAASLLFLTLFVHSRAGLYVRAVRDDEEAAEAMGIDIVRWKVAAFALGAMWAGVAGGFFAHYLGLIEPGIASLDEMAKVVLIVVVGGAGTIAGPAVGAIAVTLSQELLRGSAAVWSMLIFSVIIMLSVRFAREGLLHTALQGLARLLKGRTAPISTRQP